MFMRFQHFLLKRLKFFRKQNFKFISELSTSHPKIQDSFNSSIENSVANLGIVLSNMKRELQFETLVFPSCW